jgi:hypothetical protein
LNKDLFVQNSKLDVLTSEVNGLRGKVSEAEYDLKTVKTQASYIQQAHSSVSSNLADIKAAK